MHRALDELGLVDVVGVAVDGGLLLAEYAGFPRTLETFVAHGGDATAVLLEVSPLPADDPGRPWRSFEFVSPVLERVETCAVVGEARHAAFLERLASVLLPEALVRCFETREPALAWLRA